jgi:(p)ppGpp synthase/HD superfamily hydrolase
MIVDAFSWRIAEMVDRLTRDRPDGSKLSVEEILNNAYAKDDKEVLLVKVVDRLHNLQTIGSMSDKKQKKTALQTLDDIMLICAFLGNIEVEFKIGNIVNKILECNDDISLLTSNSYNPLFHSNSHRCFMDLFKS